MEEQTRNSSKHQFTAVESFKLVVAFFETEWSQTNLQDVQLTKITGGFVNRLHLFSRNNKAELEPSSVVIRHFGQGNQSFHEEPLASSSTLSATEQALIYHEMDRRGWGPKLYGVFSGGRLEEYIDAHPLTVTEAANESIRRDLARSYARLHSLRLPFRRNNFPCMVQELKDLAMEKRSVLSQGLLKLGDPEAVKLATQIRDTEWDEEMDWVANLFPEYRCKAAIAVGDCNFLNVLVKNYESECRTMLIDYETCTYSYRGIDIGGHFNERMYCWSNPKNAMTGYAAPDVEEQRSFCRSYLEEMRVLGIELGPQDTEEHLLLEAHIGRMWQLLFSVSMGFSGNELPDEPPLLAGLTHMMKTYWELKREWTGSGSG